MEGGEIGVSDGPLSSIPAQGPVTNNILTTLDRGDISFLILLDLSAAFDTIDHALLFEILSNTYGITDTALSWFKSYLTNRTQSVTINNLTSQKTSLVYGVPQ